MDLEIILIDLETILMDLENTWKHLKNTSITLSSWQGFLCSQVCFPNIWRWRRWSHLPGGSFYGDQIDTEVVFFIPSSGAADDGGQESERWAAADDCQQVIDNGIKMIFVAIQLSLILLQAKHCIALHCQHLWFLWVGPSSTQTRTRTDVSASRILKASLASLGGWCTRRWSSKFEERGLEDMTCSVHWVGVRS